MKYEAKPKFLLQLCFVKLYTHKKLRHSEMWLYKMLSFNVIKNEKIKQVILDAEGGTNWRSFRIYMVMLL